MAIYAGSCGSDPDKAIPKALGEQFGLTQLDCNMGADDDGVTALKVVEGEWRNSYIPYTNRPIHWHTDGYYNTPAEQIRGLILHCLSPAARGVRTHYWIMKSPTYTCVIPIRTISVH